MITLLLCCAGCESFVEPDVPKAQMVSSSVFKDVETATSVLTGIYSRMMSGSGFASGATRSITVISGLSADELVNYNTTYNPFFNNTLLVSNSTVSLDFWQEPYQYIYTANTVIEGLSSANGIPEAVSRQLEGEARFIRAFCYFYLVNFFGEVPLHLTSDHRENATRARTPVVEVYEQLITDLKEAQNLLSGDYSFSDGQRTRPNKWAATALLARVYLYRENWEQAEEQATMIIDKNSLYGLTNDTRAVFLKNSREAIWQLMPVRPGFNTMEGYQFILLETPPITQSLSAALLEAFEPGDDRRNHWIGSIDNEENTWYYPYKYKVSTGAEITEYSMVLRLAEQYLIRAEARARQGNIGGAQQDLNIIRHRAGLENTTFATQAGLLDAILQERHIEFFTEWGHRWLDLKRTGRADAVFSLIKPDWKSTAVLYPIPMDEIQRNPKITQNLGY